MNQPHNTVAVLGAGSWGTALARLIGANGWRVRLWERDPVAARELDLRRENLRYLPGHRFPDEMSVTSVMPDALDGAAVVVVAVPSGAVAEVMAEAAVCLGPAQTLLSASKGLDCNTGRRISEIVAAAAPQCAGRLAVLSGPNLAVEIAAGVPTASVIAAEDNQVAEACRAAVAGATFRVYTSSDVIGVELGGALKNVLAIGAGICEGMGFGDNTKAALLTRGLAEITRLGVALGARAETFSGLSGVGDILATSFSHLSRNLRVGLALGRGKTLAEAMDEIGQVSEGVPTTRAAIALAERTGVDMPIARETHAILFEGRPAAEGLANLMARAWKCEVHSPVFPQ